MMGEGNVGAADLAHTAALDALKRAGIQASDLDLIVFATLSPDINLRSVVYYSRS